MKTKIFCFDVESNGLYGEGFAFSAIVYDIDSDKILDQLSLRTEIDITDSFTKENRIYEKINDFKDVINSKVLRKNFFEFYLKYKELIVLVDSGYPVDNNFFQQAFIENGKNINESPYPLLDLTSILFDRGYDIDVDRYSLLNCDKEKHNPFNDALVTAKLYGKLKR